VRCPRCPDSPLEERQREGVTVDGCRTCYGIWLDRGELERLVARASSELDELERRAPPPPPVAVRREGPAARPHDDGRHRADDRDRDDRQRHPGRRRKRWFEALEDLFD
jgi:uncharacterized protein